MGASRCGEHVQACSRTCCHLLSPDTSHSCISWFSMRAKSYGLHVRWTSLSRVDCKACSRDMHAISFLQPHSQSPGPWVALKAVAVPCACRLAKAKGSRRRRIRSTVWRGTAGALQPPAARGGAQPPEGASRRTADRARELQRGERLAGVWRRGGADDEEEEEEGESTPTHFSMAPVRQAAAEEYPFGSGLRASGFEPQRHGMYVLGRPVEVR